MKKLAILAVAMLVVVPAIANGQGAPGMSPPAHVTVTVDAVLAVAAGSIMSADLGTINVGTASATVCFQVDANQQDVWIQAIATGLWKGDVMTADGFVIPIVVSGVPAEELGALVEPAIGNQIGLPTNRLPWAGADSINGLDALTSVVGHFESGQWGHFSQEVCVTIDYENTNPGLPQGDYGGWIKILAGLETW